MVGRGGDRRGRPSWVIVALAVGRAGRSSAALAVAVAALVPRSCWLPARGAARTGVAWRPWHFPAFASVPRGSGGRLRRQPFFAILQAIAYPLTWVLAADRRRARSRDRSTSLLGSLRGIRAVLRDLEAASRVLGARPIVAASGLSVSRSPSPSACGSRASSSTGEERARLVGELTAAQAEIETLSRDRGAAQERERLARECTTRSRRLSRVW